LTAGGNNFNDFAENQLTCLPENISFQKNWAAGKNTTFDLLFCSYKNSSLHAFTVGKRLKPSRMAS